MASNVAFFLSFLKIFPRPSSWRRCTIPAPESPAPPPESRMKRLLFALLFAFAATAHAASADPATTKQVNAFVDAWHDDAANARMAYFDKIAPDGVYIGTDRTELWRRDAFKTWARKYFERKSAWSFKATRRNVYASGDKSLIWFDELLDTPNMGPCMASGVIR